MKRLELLVTDHSDEGTLLWMTDDCLLATSFSTVKKMTGAMLLVVDDTEPEYGQYVLDGDSIYGPWEPGDISVASKVLPIIASSVPEIGIPLSNHFLVEYARAHNNFELLKHKLLRDNFESKEK